MDDYNDHFDAVFSANTLDVITDEALSDVLVSCKKVLKKDGYLLVSINPDYPDSLLEKSDIQKEWLYV